jgi:hypothetical protein
MTRNTKKDDDVDRSQSLCHWRKTACHTASVVEEVVGLSNWKDKWTSFDSWRKMRDHKEDLMKGEMHYLRQKERK